MSESRARRRIRTAVESRGYAVESMSYEPWYNAGEMSGIGGGWEVILDRAFGTFYNDFHALSVDEMLAEIDYWLKPETPCGCDRKHHAVLASNIKGDPQKTTHSPTCAHHIKYRLPWWSTESAAS